MAVFSKFAVSVAAVAVGYEEESLAIASALQLKVEKSGVKTSGVSSLRRLGSFAAAATASILLMDGANSKALTETLSASPAIPGSLDVSREISKQPPQKIAPNSMDAKTIIANVQKLLPKLLAGVENEKLRETLQEMNKKLSKTLEEMLEMLVAHAEKEAAVELLRKEGVAKAARIAAAAQEAKKAEEMLQKKLVDVATELQKSEEVNCETFGKLDFEQQLDLIIRRRTNCEMVQQLRRKQNSKQFSISTEKTMQWYHWVVIIFSFIVVGAICTCLGCQGCQGI